MNILITGISSGIGEAIALEYLKQGHQVYGVSRRNSQQLAAFDSYQFQSLDLHQFEQISPTIAKFLSKVESLDLAILNAGILGHFGDLGETGLNQMQQTMDVNLWANKVLLDVLFQNVQNIQQVVAISSGASVNGNRGWGAYSISKAALNMLIKLYATEQMKTHFSSFAPGIVDTPMQAQISQIDTSDRFHALKALQAKRGTLDMPSPEVAAIPLIEAILKLPQLVASGDYADVRNLPE